MLLLFFIHQHSLFLNGLKGSTHCQTDEELVRPSTQYPTSLLPLNPFELAQAHNENTTASISNLPAKLIVELITYDC